MITIVNINCDSAHTIIKKAWSSVSLISQSCIVCLIFHLRSWFSSAEFRRKQALPHFSPVFLFFRISYLLSLSFNLFLSFWLYFSSLYLSLSVHFLVTISPLLSTYYPRMLSIQYLLSIIFFILSQPTYICLIFSLSFRSYSMSTALSLLPAISRYSRAMCIPFCSGHIGKQKDVSIRFESQVLCVVREKENLGVN